MPDMSTESALRRRLPLRIENRNVVPKQISSRHQRGDDIASHIRQPIIPSLKPMRQSQVIQPKQAQNRRVKIVDVNRILRDIPADVVGGAVGQAAFGAAAGHE